jgi:hypothetical protein
VEYFSRRAAKLREVQGRARLALTQLAQGGVEMSGSGESKLAERLFFSST